MQNVLTVDGHEMSVYVVLQAAILNGLVCVATLWAICCAKVNPASPSPLTQGCWRSATPQYLAKIVMHAYKSSLLQVKPTLFYSSSLFQLVDPRRSGIHAAQDDHRTRNISASTQSFLRCTGIVTVDVRCWAKRIIIATRRPLPKGTDFRLREYELHDFLEAIELGYPWEQDIRYYSPLVTRLTSF